MTPRILYVDTYSELPEPVKGHVWIQRSADRGVTKYWEEINGQKFGAWAVTKLKRKNWRMNHLTTGLRVFDLVCNKAHITKLARYLKKHLNDGVYLSEDRGKVLCAIIEFSGAKYGTEGDLTRGEFLRKLTSLVDEERAS